MTASPRLHHFESPAAAAARIARLDLGPAATPLIAASGADLAAAARALVAAGMAGEAVGVLGQALERRAAVWWACLAARSEPAPLPEETAAGDGLAARTSPYVLPASEAAALDAAEAWVRQPDALRAHAALAAAETAGAGSPAACAALAAFFAGDSIAPPDGAPVPPPDHVAGLVSASAVQITAARHRPDLTSDSLAMLLERGFAIAAGKDSWEN
jgi:hypothetical protein